MFMDGLALMIQMGDDEVRREDRHGIAEDQVVAPVEDPLLPIRETIQAEETGPPFSIFLAHLGLAAPDPSWIVLDADGESPAGKVSFLDGF